MRVLIQLVLFLFCTCVEGGFITYQGITEPDQQVVAQHRFTGNSSLYSYALDRLNQKKLPLDQRYYSGRWTGRNINVYVIDTGMRPNAYFKYTCGQDFVDSKSNCLTSAIHGTHVGSLIQSPTFGTAPGTHLVNLRVLDDRGFGKLSTVIQAIDYVLSRNVTCSIINMSLGSGFSEILNRKVRELAQAGNQVVVAAGNHYGDACQYSPSSAPDAITVGALNRKDRRAPFSNSGACVDVYSPGVAIPGASGGHTYSKMDGTSASAPLVSGLLAMRMEQKGCRAKLRMRKTKTKLKIALSGKK